MKLLIVGAGGIGSYFARELSDVMKQGYTGPLDVTIADDDMVEVNQIMYQNFQLEDVGMYKAQAIAKKYNFKWSEWRVDSKFASLGEYDMIVLCVDNNKTRKFIVEYCHKNNKEFIDLRATGRRVCIFPKISLKQDMRFIDDDDKSYSCQDKDDKASGKYQIGNRIAAVCGVQMVINVIRGQVNIQHHILTI